MLGRKLFGVQKLVKCPEFRDQAGGDSPCRAVASAARFCVSMPKAVISIIKGGLGNQLFIYSAGRAYALRTKREFYLDDRGGYTHDDYGRDYRLNRLPIEALPMPEKWRVAPTLKHPRHKAVRAFNKFLPMDWRSYLAQRGDLGPAQLTERKPCRERVTLNGYWQDEGYFRYFADVIRRELEPPAPTDERNLALGREVAAENAVFIHARRVRYPVLLPADYYRKAIAGIREKVSDPSFVVFSDDQGWTRENLDLYGDKVRWVEHNAQDEFADLWLMTRCRHAIIANSSFSWWGAWLGGDPADGRIIYSPDHPDWMIRPAKGWQTIPFGI